MARRRDVFSPKKKKSQRSLEHQAWVRMSGHAREASPADKGDNRPVAKASNI